MIEFETADELAEFIAKLTKLTGLQQLVVDDNPFFERDRLFVDHYKNLKLYSGGQGIDNFKAELITRLKNLEELNGDDRQALQRQMEKAQVQEENK